MDAPSKGLWIIFSKDSLTVLYTLMTFLSPAPTSDLTLNMFETCSIFSRLHGLSINPAKCTFAAPAVDYLGIRVSGSGCIPLAKHTEIISPFPRPTDKKGLKRFLGILNFYRRFIKATAGLLRPLTFTLGRVNLTPPLNPMFNVKI